jgi:DNA-binding MarR family transcriptional regulator
MYWQGIVMTQDVLRALGFLCLGSRLKRIGERLQADTQRIMDEMSIPLQASQYPLLAAIDRLGPLTVGELAEAVGITQPGATRSLAQLVELGLLDTRNGADDRRQRIISLTKQGQRLIDASKRDVWPRVEAAVVDLCGELSGPLLKQLASIEDGLAALPLVRRGAQAGTART